MVEIATPVSHFFKNKQYASQIIKYSDCLEVRDNTHECPTDKCKVFHCELQPIHHLTSSEISFIQNVIKKNPCIDLISFHVASTFKNPIISNGSFVPNGQELGMREMIANAKNNFSVIRNAVGSNIKLAIENNNYLGGRAYKYIAEPSFISDLVYDNDLYFLLDIAHAKISAHNLERDYLDYRNKLPLDRLIQLHICKPALSKENFAYDAHRLPSQKEFNEISNLLKSRKSIRYLTLEYYKDINKILISLKKIRELLNDLY